MNKEQKTYKNKPGKYEPLPLADFSAVELEHRPVAMIAGDVLARSIVQKPALPITEDSMIKSFQNGLSKGFASGLETGLRFIQQHQGIGYTIPELCKTFENFMEESKNEQKQGS